MLAVKNITRKFGNKIALNNINLTFKRGEIYSLIGPNGVGKTTLIHILSGVLYPDYGDVLIENKVAESHVLKNKVMACLAGDRGLHWRCTGIQNIEYFMALKGFTRKVTLAKVSEYMNKFDIGISYLLNKRVETMSFGQKKKILVFLGLLSGAEFLIFDEITEGIDVESREELVIISREIARQGKTMIFATHDLAFAQEVTDHAVFMNDGSVFGIYGSDVDFLANYKIMRGDKI